MPRLIRSADVQMRVTGELKEGIEAVLRRMGLNTSDAAEMFFRYIASEGKLPPDVEASRKETASSRGASGGSPRAARIDARRIGRLARRQVYALQQEAKFIDVDLVDLDLESPRNWDQIDPAP